MTWMEEGERVGGRKVGKRSVDCCARINNIVALSRAMGKGKGRLLIDCTKRRMELALEGLFNGSHGLRNKEPLCLHYETLAIEYLTAGPWPRNLCE